MGDDLLAIYTSRQEFSPYTPPHRYYVHVSHTTVRHKSGSHLDSVVCGIRYKLGGTSKLPNKEGQEERISLVYGNDDYASAPAIFCRLVGLDPLEGLAISGILGRWRLLIVHKLDLDFSDMGSCMERKCDNAAEMRWT